MKPVVPIPVFCHTNCLISGCVFGLWSICTIPFFFYSDVLGSNITDRTVEFGGLAELCSFLVCTFCHIVSSSDVKRSSDNGMKDRNTNEIYIVCISEYQRKRSQIEARIFWKWS